MSDSSLLQRYRVVSGSLDMKSWFRIKTLQEDKQRLLCHYLEPSFEVLNDVTLECIDEGVLRKIQKLWDDGVQDYQFDYLSSYVFGIVSHGPSLKQRTQEALRRKSIREEPIAYLGVHTSVLMSSKWIIRRASLSQLESQ